MLCLWWGLCQVAAILLSIPNSGIPNSGGQKSGLQTRNYMDVVIFFFWNPFIFWFKWMLSWRRGLECLSNREGSITVAQHAAQKLQRCVSYHVNKDGRETMSGGTGPVTDANYRYSQYRASNGMRTPHRTTTQLSRRASLHPGFTRLQVGQLQ